MNDTILMTKNLTKKYNHVLALDNINLSIERGKFMASSVRTEQEKQR